MLKAENLPCWRWGSRGDRRKLFLYVLVLFLYVLVLWPLASSASRHRAADRALTRTGQSGTLLLTCRASRTKESTMSDLRSSKYP